MGVKISKRYSYSYCSFSTKLFLKVPCDSPHKSYLYAFRNLKLIFLKVRNLTLWLMGKWKIANIFERASRGTKRSEIRDSGIV